MASLLTTASSLQCPHGGTVAMVSANLTVRADAPLVLASDTFSISGCPFQIPVGTGTVPHPCVKVQWITTNPLARVNGADTLTRDSVGICLAADQAPQGPVAVLQVQPRVGGA